MTTLGGYPIHPACAMLPMMPEEAIVELAEDIRRFGQQQPIWLFEGMVLDGRNRLRACLLAGVAPEVREWRGDDPIRWVLSLNFHRRHLTDTQKAVVGARAELLLAEREAAQAQAGEADDRPSGVDGEPKPLRASDYKRARTSAAALVNVSERAIARGRQLIERAVPDLVDAVERGEVPMGAAATVAALEPERQQEIVDAGDLAIVEEARRLRDERRASRPPGLAVALDRLDAALPNIALIKTPDGRWRVEGTNPVLSGPIVGLGRSPREALAEACRELERFAPEE